MNDTHPAIAVAELMRLLIDEHCMEWDAAWHVTQHTLSYTNHTLLPEALEQWPRRLFGALLPRHLEIVDEINRRHLEDVRQRFPGDEERAQRLSLIDENGEKYVRMAHLAALGSHAINGVAALHTELLKTNVLRDFYELTPEKFSNKTNGVTPRRWMVLSNPGLAQLLTARLGVGWIHDLEKLRRLEPLVADRELHEEWRAIKLHNKTRLAHYIQDRLGIAIDPASMFDVLVKRLHEYKRQHLQVLHILTLYKRIQRDPRRRGCAAHLHLRRQGRARLPHGQAHHQAHSLRRRGRQRRPAGAGKAEGGLSPRLQREARPAGLSRRRPFRADLPGRQGSLRNRQHEVRHERRAHHRHPGRRQHRDSRGSGRGELLPLRPDHT